jgi:hypothetical protein
MKLLVGLITLVSWISLFAQRLIEAFWPVIALTVFYAGLALLGLWQDLAVGGQGIVFLVFLFIAVLLCLRRVQEFTAPTLGEALRAAEIAGGIAHRAFSQHRDTPAGKPDTQQKGLWQKTQARLKQQALQLSAPLPRARLAGDDPYGLRHAAIMTAVLGMVIAGPVAKDRLAQAFFPRLPSVKIAGATMPQNIDIWVTPPEYTGHPVQKIFPRASKEDVEKPLSVAAHSVLKITGTGDPPHIALNGDTIKYAENDTSFTAERLLTEPVRMTVGFWPWDRQVFLVDLIPDKPPVVQLHLAGRGTRDNLKIVYSASDDYGLSALTATITSNDNPDIVYETPVPISAFGADVTTAHIDLTRHPLTGQAATVVLTGIDAAGQSARTAPATVIVPEKTFKSAAAQRLAFESKRLRNFTDPLTRLMSGKAVADVAEQPALYGGRPIIFLGLSVAFHRLERGRDETASLATSPLLWDLALEVEDSGLGTAARELSEALQDFARTLQDKDATQAQIQERLAQVREKMQAYARALAAEMQQKQLNTGSPGLSPELAERLFKRIDMDALMKRIADMRRGDSREQMRKMAEMLQQSVDNFDPEEAARQREAAAALFAALDRLKSLIDRQQHLHDATRLLDSAEDFKGTADNQQELTKDSKNVKQDIEAATKSPAPPDMDAASAAMEQAEKELRQEKSSDAAEQQQVALKALQKMLDDTLDELAKQMESQMALSMLQGGMDPGDGMGGERDPLGRPVAPKNTDVKLPTEQEKRTVQDILQELQKRSGDYKRPDQERDYLRRLLELF